AALLERGPHAPGRQARAARDGRTSALSGRRPRVRGGPHADRKAGTSPRARQARAPGAVALPRPSRPDGPRSLDAHLGEARVALLGPGTGVERSVPRRHPTKGSIHEPALRWFPPPDGDLGRHPRQQALLHTSPWHAPGEAKREP